MRSRLLHQGLPMTMIRGTAFLLPFLFSATRLLAQEPVQPYDASGRYRTGGVEAQLTGAFGGGRDVLFSWGGMAVGGRGGRWMQRTELAAGLHAGQNLVDRVMLGPQASLALAEPGWYTELERATRAEPYLQLGAGAFGVADFSGDEAEFGLSPTVSLGVGLRLFDDEWDIALTQVELAVRQRFGVAEAAPQLYLRFSRATPRQRASTAAVPQPAGPAPLPPPPPR